MTQGLTTWRLTAANIRFKPLSALFNILLLAMGVAMIIALFDLNHQMNAVFTRDLKGIDLVVSGKGSPLQIILSTVFQLDVPTGNIPLSEADRLKANPLIKQAIPLAMGDNFNGYRIVGTDADYVAHYHGAIAQGRMFDKPMEVTLGSEVARRDHVAVGQSIIGAHGLVNSDDLHSDFPYTVVGILAPTGTVLDRVVLTPVESVWHVHEHPDPDDPEAAAYKNEHPETQLTALLIAYRTPLAAAQLPRLINKSSSMQAASPAFEFARLSRLMDTGSEILSAFGILLVGFAVFGFFVTQYNAIQERRYDIALMRSLGATRSKIVGFIFAETVALGAAGALAGVVLAHLFLLATAQWVYATKFVALGTPGIGTVDIAVCCAALAISLIAGIVPAIRAYRIDIVQTLAQA